MIIKIENETLDIFALRLKELRTQNNFTQKGLADVTQMGLQTIQRFETKKAKQIRDYELDRLAFALKCTQDYLLGKSSEPLKLENGLEKVVSIDPLFKEKQRNLWKTYNDNLEYFTPMINILKLGNEEDKGLMLSMLNCILQKIELETGTKKR